MKGKTTSRGEDLINSWYYSMDDSVTPSLWQKPGEREAVRVAQLASLMVRIEGLQQRRAKVVNMRRRAFRMAAAAVIGAIVIIVGIYLPRWQKDRSLQYAVITAPLGKIKRVVLPDSSVVWLKSGTTFRYNNKYGYSNREVDLVEGEAWFDVQKDDRRPFLVNTGRLQTRVLGTSFNIQAYKDNSVIEVWVDHGRVQVSDSGSVLKLLTHDHRLQWQRNNGHFATDSLRWHQALAWQKGILLLESASFDEMAVQLKEIYGCNIITEDPAIRRQLYDAKFFIRSPLKTVLQTLSEVHHIQFKSQNGQVLFY